MAGFERLITFDTTYGVQQRSLASGEHITAISAASWPDFLQAFDETAATQALGDLVVSPELITTAEHPLRDIPAATPQAAARLTEIAERSQDNPSKTLIIGTVAMSGDRLRNAQVFLRGGELIGTNYKMPYTQAERDVLWSTPTYSQHHIPGTTILPMICSDLRYHAMRGLYEGVPEQRQYVNPITDETTAVVASSCWALPVYTESRRLLDSEQQIGAFTYFTGLLEYSRRVFMDRSRIQDIVMCDRAPAGGPIGHPLNFHYQRPQEQ